MKKKAYRTQLITDKEFKQDLYDECRETGKDLDGDIIHFTKDIHYVVNMSTDTVIEYELISPIEKYMTIIGVVLLAVLAAISIPVTYLLWWDIIYELNEGFTDYVRLTVDYMTVCAIGIVILYLTIYMVNRGYFYAFITNKLTPYHRIKYGNPLIIIGVIGMAISGLATIGTIVYSTITYGFGFQSFYHTQYGLTAISIGLIILLIGFVIADDKTHSITIQEG